MEDVLPSGLLEICLLVGVPRERVRALLQVRGGSGRGRESGAGGGGGSALTRRVCGAASVSAVLSSEV